MNIPIDTCANVNTAGQSVHSVGHVFDNVAPLAVATCLKLAQELAKLEFIAPVVLHGSEK